MSTAAPMTLSAEFAGRTVQCRRGTFGWTLACPGGRVNYPFRPPVEDPFYVADRAVHALGLAAVPGAFPAVYQLVVSAMELTGATDPVPA